MEKGMEVGGNKMEWRREWEREEILLMEDNGVRCWREWAKMVDTIWTFIQVTYDCPGLNSNGMVPILDLNVRMEWHEEEVEGVGLVRMQQIVWRFYQKPMNSPYVIMAASAMPQKVKITTMVQEVIRRMRNMNKWVEKDEIDDELTLFCVKMKMSGYGESVRREVLLSGIKGFERMKRNHVEGKRNLYRKQEEGKELRWARKIHGKESWFKGEGGDNDDNGGREIVKGSGGRYMGGIWWSDQKWKEKSGEVPQGRHPREKAPQWMWEVMEGTFRRDP